MDLRFLTTLPGFPRRAMSRGAGALARMPVPRGLRAPLWRFVGRRLGIDPASVPGELRDYRCFLDLFARPLPEGARPLDMDGGWMSPADGRLVARERVTPEGSWVIKGTPYATHELLPDADPAELRDYQALQIYLAPRDYHRYHAPCALRVERATMAPGGLQPVDPALVKRSMRVLEKNRRVLLHCRAEDGTPLWLLYVGALNVGGMRFTFDETLGLPPYTRSTRAYDPQPRLAPGEEMGRFEFGSTVVLFAPSSMRSRARVDDRVQARRPLLEAPV